MMHSKWTWFVVGAVAGAAVWWGTRSPDEVAGAAEASSESPAVLEGAPAHSPEATGAAEADGTGAPFAEQLRPLAEALRRVRHRSAARGGVGEGDAPTRPGDSRSPPGGAAAGEREGADAGEGADDAPADAPTFATDRDGIQSAMSLAIDDVRDCYEQWLALNPDLAGRIVVGYRIAPDPEDPSRGRVVDAEVQAGGLGNQFLEGCVVASLDSLRFDDPPAEGIEVTYPLTFSNEGPPDP